MEDPYTWQEAKEYYRLADHAKDWVFKDETGLPSQPTYNSLIKIIPDLVWDTKLPFPLNNSWGYHDAATGNGKYDAYYEAMVRKYGAPASMEEFSDKMQLMNATGYQGTFESAGHRLNDIGGIMLWKLNAAFPSVVWQIYDWYLEPNAGYYFMQNGIEPVHVQLNMLNHVVTVVNRNYKACLKSDCTSRCFWVRFKTIVSSNNQSKPFSFRCQRDVLYIGCFSQLQRGEFCGFKPERCLWKSNFLIMYTGSLPTTTIYRSIPCPAQKLRRMS